ncbi:hypothetical protein SISNIDRAFT_469526 [Sistotremastrum niveocremeum HHB9708]|uniref:Uncharacterized protein n=1 Tax=Sistotremastrum niveocremeum HHB9708 TaxID=1314777 RepID=A0A164Q202_9AGAM|nr:hypothetical protein SISNIDRAFT_469526 [Sistotremastrum niveocremeum HHB9708]
MSEKPSTPRPRFWLSVAFASTALLSVVLLLTYKVNIVNDDHSVSHPHLLKAKAWQLPNNRKVALYRDDTDHYPLDEDSHIMRQEFAYLAPRQGLTIKLDGDNSGQLYAVSMVHQLWCLDVIRHDWKAKNITHLTEHCMNYLRQSIHCTADTHLEGMYVQRKPSKLNAYHYDAICDDWTAVYDALPSLGTTLRF